MTQYTHRMTLAVPELMIPQANQLALFAGESADDVNTFMQANYQDSNGNLYAVCSTVIKPIVLGMFGQTITDNALAQQALDAAVMYAAGAIATPNNILIGIDIEPHQFFALVGLSAIERMEVV